MSRMIRAAFWPEEKKIGCAAIQRKLNCNPDVARWFPTDMVTMQTLNSPVYIFEATEDQWRKMARTWAVIDHRDSPTWARGTWVH